MYSINPDSILGSWMSEGWRFRLEIIAEDGGYSDLLAKGL
jgi:hypothetical protein